MIKEIIDGWKNFIVRTPLVEEEAERRANICTRCEYAKNDGIPRCGICNCPLAMKTRSSLSECPYPKEKGGAKW